ncbi:MAG: virulence RhuM family protein [Bacilli bacterium]|nr:virulence RhuM family protein [Bacilli bacterium]
MKDETVWLSQQQMSELFDSSRTNIVEHINNIYSDGELEKSSTCQDFRQVRKEGKREVVRNIPFYSLDMIISVGYRVNSKKGIVFRKWANSVLKEYLLKGYAVNRKRLECLEKTVKLIDIANRNIDINENDAKEIIKVIGDYSKA